MNESDLEKAQEELTIQLSKNHPQEAVTNNAEANRRSMYHLLLEEANQPTMPMKNMTLNSITPDPKAAFTPEIPSPKTFG